MRGASIVVGDGAWVGANATILPGVSVAARAVVSRDVPPNVIVAGVPAKAVRKLDSEMFGQYSGQPPEKKKP